MLLKDYLYKFFWCVLFMDEKLSIDSRVEIETKYDIFGRGVEFKDIRGIEKVIPSSILDPSYFFNPESFENIFRELCGHGKKDILVCFNGFEGEITPYHPNEERKWWEVFQSFVSYIGEDFPAGCELEYFYGDGSGKAKISPEFDESNPPYQALIKLFNNALQGFSCFVNKSEEGVRINSESEDIRQWGGWIPSKRSLWIGKPDVFLESTEILIKAFYGMRGDYCSKNIRRGEIRIIDPGRGALVGSLNGNLDGNTFLIKEDSLDSMVQSYKERYCRD